jgi:hypothetical protein
MTDLDIEELNPPLAVEKTVTSQRERHGVRAGREIEYEVTVTNDGNHT